MWCALVPKMSTELCQGAHVNPWRVFGIVSHRAACRHELRLHRVSVDDTAYRRPHALCLSSCRLRLSRSNNPKHPLDVSEWTLAKRALVLAPIKPPSHKPRRFNESMSCIRAACLFGPPDSKDNNLMLARPYDSLCYVERGVCIWREIRRANHLKKSLAVRCLYHGIASAINLALGRDGDPVALTARGVRSHPALGAV